MAARGPVLAALFPAVWAFFTADSVKLPYIQPGATVIYDAKLAAALRSDPPAGRCFGMSGGSRREGLTLAIMAP